MMHTLSLIKFFIQGTISFPALFSSTNLSVLTMPSYCFHSCSPITISCNQYSLSPCVVLEPKVKMVKTHTWFLSWWHTGWWEDEDRSTGGDHTLWCAWQERHRELRGPSPGLQERGGDASAEQEVCWQGLEVQEEEYWRWSRGGKRSVARAEAEAASKARPLKMKDDFVLNPEGKGSHFTV